MNRMAVYFTILAAAALLLVFLTLLLGPVGLSFADVCRSLAEPWGEDVAHRIVWDLRIPRLVAALLAGGALAVSGLTLQSVFRNPLTDPYVLGVSSGASLGAAVAILLGLVNAITKDRIAAFAAEKTAAAMREVLDAAAGAGVSAVICSDMAAIAAARCSALSASRS